MHPLLEQSSELRSCGTRIGCMALPSLLTCGLGAGERAGGRPLFDNSGSECGSRAPGARGKSELRRAGCRLTAGRREATESATEKRPPMAVARWHRQG